MEITTYKDIKLKNGQIIPKNTKGFAYPIKDQDFACEFTYYTGKEAKDNTIILRYGSLFQPPKTEELSEWVFDSVCDSILGESVEPDGHDSEGFPSWLLALGMI